MGARASAGPGGHWPGHAARGAAAAPEPGPVWELPFGACRATGTTSVTCQLEVDQASIQLGKFRLSGHPGPSPLGMHTPRYRSPPPHSAQYSRVRTQAAAVGSAFSARRWRVGARSYRVRQQQKAAEAPLGPPHSGCATLRARAQTKQTNRSQRATVSRQRRSPLDPSPQIHDFRPEALLRSRKCTPVAT